MLSISLVNIGFWLLFLKCGFALYVVSDRFNKGYMPTVFGVQLIIVLLIVSKYVELYALTIFHSKEVQLGHLSYIAVILAASLICQLVCLHYRQTSLAIGLTVLTALNTGVIAYLSLVVS